MERKNPAELIKNLKAEVMALIRKTEVIDPREFALAPLFNQNLELAEALRPKLEAYHAANEEWHRLNTLLYSDSRNEYLLRFNPAKKRLFAPAGSALAPEETAGVKTPDKI